MRTVGRLRDNAAWISFIAFTFVASALFLLLPERSWVGAVIYLGVGFGEVAALVWGLRRHRPSRKLPWYLFTVGAGMYAVANTLWYGAPILLRQKATFPSVADPVFITAYLFFLAALAVLIRERVGAGEGFGSLVDALIVTFSVGVLAWEYLLGPLGSGTQASSLSRLVSLAYPILDLALLALATRVFFTRGPRTPAFWLLAGFVICQLAADTTYAITTLNDTFYLGHPLTVGWLMSFGCLGAAALHPSMQSVTQGPPAGMVSPLPLSRLAFLAVAAAVVPVIYLIDSDRAELSEVLVTTIVVSSFCIARMAVLVRDLARQAGSLTRQERQLRSTIDALHRSEGNLAHLAHHDALTGLPNRALFDQRLQTALQRPDRSVAVMLLDLDRFKTVNDSLGHVAGDRLLVAVGGRLNSAIRPGDTIARLGGDEFTILAQGIDHRAATRLVGRLLRTLDEPVEIDGRKVFVRASVGLTVCAGGCENRELLREADSAMYEAKRKGGQRYETFSADMHARVLDRLSLECDLRAAELGSDITVHYQPLVDLSDGRLCGFEALLRWSHAERGMVAPCDFIPIAEETGLIVPVGVWVLRQACSQARQWAAEHPERGPLTMSVNVSARQLADPAFVDQVAATLIDTDLDPGLLTLEITETMMMADEDDVCRRLHQLKQLGLRISVDDFGTGYSSLGHLRRFPVDELKIDRSFVAAMGEDADGANVASATIRLARSLQIEVVAEGIESEDQLCELRRTSCNRGQGYYLGRPMDSVAVSTLLNQTDRPAQDNQAA